MTEQDTPKMTHDEMIDVLKGLVFGTFDRTTAKEREALDMAISALSENKGDWIPVSERLPEDSEWQLVSVMDCEGFSFALPRIARIETDGKWHYANAYENQYDYFYKVVAWQPIPEPYRKGE